MKYNTYVNTTRLLDRHETLRDKIQPVHYTANVYQ